MRISRRRFVHASSAAAAVAAAATSLRAVEQTSELPAAIRALKPFPGKATPIPDAERLARIEKARRLMADHGMSAIVLEPGTSMSYGTFIYFTRLQMVAALGDDTDMRTTVFAQIDLITQVTTFVLQAVVTGHLMKRFGVAVALVLLPVMVSLGFIGLAIVGSFAMLIGFDATFRAVQRAITRPARETLFTVVSREDKYKSKAFTDTFVYRGGDVLGAWTEGLLGRLGLALAGLASVAVPLAVAWAFLGLWLGHRQEELKNAKAPVARAGALAREVV